MTKGKRWKNYLRITLAIILLAAMVGCSDDDTIITTAPTTPAETLSAPEEVAVTAGDAAVTIQWSEVAGADSYNLYRDVADGVTRDSATAVKTAGVTSPHIDQPLTNGTTYYYVLTAVNGAGESPESPEFSATPRVPAPDSPRNLTALLTPETTLSVTLQWDPPDPDTAVSYNLYRGLTAGFSADLTAATQTVGVNSPHIDQVPVGGVTYYYAVTAVNNVGGESLPSAEVSAAPRGSHSTTGGDSGFGNNLSAPLIFADGIGMGGAALTGTWLDTSAGPVAYDPVLTPIDFNTGLRPTSTETFTEYPNLDPATVYIDPADSTPYYEQQTENSWQAEWRNGAEAPVHVTSKWGDNLGSVTYGADSVIRVETGLDNIPDTPMWQYPMQLLYGSQVTEMQGTTGIPEQISLAQVYAVNARLKIEKLDGPGGNVVGTFFDKAVWESFGTDGPGGYAGEINVAGKLTYGYVWFMRDVTEIQPDGWWRLTFSLDPTFQASGVGNTVIDACTNCTGADLAQNTIWIELQIAP